MNEPGTDGRPETQQAPQYQGLQEQINKLPDICMSCRWLEVDVNRWSYEDRTTWCSNLAQAWVRDHVERQVLGAPALKACHLTEEWACPLWARDLGDIAGDWLCSIPDWLWLIAQHMQAFLWHLRLGLKAWEVTRRQITYYKCLLGSHRAGKLLLKGKTFVVVAVDESYFATVYGMIRGVEQARGRWTDADEMWMIRALDEWQEVCPARASVKAGWRLAPETCPECGAVMAPVAHDTGEGWWLGYECEQCGECTVADEGIIDWPFVEERATAADLMAIGFTVV